MQFRVSAGLPAVSAAASLHGEGGLFARLNGEGSFVLFDATDLTYDAACDVIRALDSQLGIAIASADAPEVISALTVLKRIVVGFERDAYRDIYMRSLVQPPVEEAVETDAGSHPTDTGDTVISNASQRSADDENEETENEAHEEGQHQQQPRRRQRRG